MEREKGRSEFRVNVFILAVIGAVLVGVLAALFQSEATAVLAIAGSLLGSYGLVMRELTKGPAPEPVVEEPYVRMPVSSFENVVGSSRSEREAFIALDERLAQMERQLSRDGAEK